jgi:arsenate reductase
MEKVFYLATCDTCKRVMKEIDIPSHFETIDIKASGISEEDLEDMVNLAGSYESLFSRRARLYRERDLKNKNLKEDDMKDLILEHYTFLKRPVIIDGEDIFIGSSAKTVASAKKTIHAN